MKDGVTLNKELLLPLVKQNSATSDCAWCEHHQRECFLETCDVHVSGFPCVSWSPQGSRKADNGDDFRMWSAWAANRRKKKDWTITITIIIIIIIMSHKVGLIYETSGIGILILTIELEIINTEDS